MKQIYLYITIAILLLILSFQTCQPNPSNPPPLINSDSIAKLAYGKGYEIAKLEQIGKVKDSIQTHYVTKWKVYREKAIHDTITRECIANCDSAINTQSDYICHLETINSHKDTAIVYWREAYRGDSTNNRTKDKMIADTVKYFGKRVRRGYIKGFLHGFTTGNVTGVVFVGTTLRR